MKRRRSQLRELGKPNGKLLPPDGWVLTTPGDPPADCSWCSRPLAVLPSGVVFCGSCDQLPRPYTPGPAWALSA